MEASLRRLGVERIDLYQMHWPAEDGTPLEEYWQVFADLKRVVSVERLAQNSFHRIPQSKRLTLREKQGSCADTSQSEQNEYRSP